MDRVLSRVWDTTGSATSGKHVEVADLVEDPSSDHVGHLWTGFFEVPLDDMCEIMLCGV